MISLNMGYVALPVASKVMDELRQWYETQLDLDRVQLDDDRFVVAGKNGFAIEFRAGRPLDDPGRVVLAFVTESVDALFEQMKGTMSFAGGPEDTPFGRRVLRLQDPAGHTVELFEADAEEGMPNLRDARREAGGQ